MSKDIIDYQDLVKTALKGVLRDILRLVDQKGLIGEQHYYITFRTGDNGVRVPKRLKSQYPGEMTIVIQHRYWDLKVDEDKFEIGLSFNQKPEHLVIPYASVTSIVDPSARFALQFDAPEKAGADEKRAGKPSEKQSEDPKDGDRKEQEKVVSIDAFRKS